MSTIPVFTLSKTSDYKFDMSRLTKAFIGDANWDIYVDEKGALYSVAKPECRGENGYNMDTFFGDKHHIRRLMAKGYFTCKPTDAGLGILSGLCSVIYTPENSAPFSILQFHTH